MRKILRIIFSVIMGTIGFFLFQFLYVGYLATMIPEKFQFFIVPVVGILVLILSYILLSSTVVDYVLKKMKRIEDSLGKMALKEILVDLGGILVGLIIANLLGIAILQYGLIGTFIVLALNLVLGYLGYQIAQKKQGEIKLLEVCATGEHSFAKPKVLDTSVIIDGRILDILKTGLIEGKILIPTFVLQELRHIADSSDSLKRNRGRRGLDILNEIQKQTNVPVEIIDVDYKEIAEVDSKLLKMGEEMDAVIVTNDFNLNKVADFQGVVVFNINELANAVKPIVLPGENMKVTVIKDGKEDGQGVAYLNDGTMIVVEGGRRHIGDSVDVLVTSVLQTAAGRMIFTKIKEA